MGRIINININKITHKQVICIRNILRDLGLSTSLKGTTLLNKAIQFVIVNNNEFIILEEVYESISSYYKDMNSAQIKMAIKYALDNRNENKSKKNFERIFGFEYDEFYFTNKTIIEEIARIILFLYNVRN